MSNGGQPEDGLYLFFLLPFFLRVEEEDDAVGGRVEDEERSKLDGDATGFLDDFPVGRGGLEGRACVYPTILPVALQTTYLMGGVATTLIVGFDFGGRTGEDAALLLLSTASKCDGGAIGLVAATADEELFGDAAANCWIGVDCGGCGTMTLLGGVGVNNFGCWADAATGCC